MFAPKKLDLTESARAPVGDVDIEVLALIDDLDQFFDGPMRDTPLLTETQEIEPEPEPAPAPFPPMSMEEAILAYIARTGRPF